MKKLLQKVADLVIQKPKYSHLEKVEVFFVFGSPHKTAMCQWVYGMKIYSNLDFTLKTDLIKDFQMDIRKICDKNLGQSVCATDVLFEKSISSI